MVLIMGAGLAEAQPGVGYPPPSWGPPPYGVWNQQNLQPRWGSPPPYMAPGARYAYPPTPPMYMPNYPPQYSYPVYPPTPVIQQDPYPVYGPVVQQDSPLPVEILAEQAPPGNANLPIGGGGSNADQEFGVTKESPAPPPVRNEAPPSPPSESSAAPAELTNVPTYSDLNTQQCAPRYHGWIVPEYLLWFAKPGPLTVPIVTTGSATGTNPGVLGQSDTKVLFGGSDIKFPAANGFRATFGKWIDPDNKLGVEASGFILENATVNFARGSDGTGTPVLAIPVFNTATGNQGAFYVSYPSTATIGSSTGSTQTGSVFANFASQLYGGELNGMYNLLRTRGFDIDFLGGFRYLNLQESFNLSANFLYNLDNYAVNESFQASNQFFGGQVGLRMSYQRGSIFSSVTLKGALGTNLESTNVHGSTNINPLPPGITSNPSPGGFFAQTSNIGRQTHLTPYSAVPQLTAKIGWEATNNIRFFAGYDFLYWFNVIRPGPQIDRNVNETQSVVVNYPQSTQGPPSRMFQTSNYFAQGITLGVEFRY